VEFAVALPILILLVAGLLELSRGYAAAIATSDAARSGARYAAGKTAGTNGPGMLKICNLVTADLATLTTNVSCPLTPVGHAPPFKGTGAGGSDFTSPIGGQVVVAVYCGASADCTGTTYALSQSEIDVYVYYGFNDLNLFGNLITISGSSKTITSW
jgi:Flp pilus assembly protein TadG